MLRRRQCRYARVRGHDVECNQLVPDGDHLIGKSVIVGDSAAGAPVRERQKSFCKGLCQCQAGKAGSATWIEPQPGSQMRDGPGRSPPPWQLPDAERTTHPTCRVFRAVFGGDPERLLPPINRGHERNPFMQPTLSVSSDCPKVLRPGSLVTTNRRGEPCELERSGPRSVNAMHTRPETVAPLIGEMQSALSPADAVGHRPDHPRQKAQFLCRGLRCAATSHGPAQFRCRSVMLCARIRSQMPRRSKLVT